MQPISKIKKGDIYNYESTYQYIYKVVNEKAKVISYFCAPYHAWEKELVKNTIGLLRQYFPKKTNFDTITDEQITKVQQLINNSPRKSLDFKTPAEVFSVAFIH